jgi:hypothetical protein
MSDLTRDASVRKVLLVKLAQNGFDRRLNRYVYMCEVDRGLNQVFRAKDDRDARKQSKAAFPHAHIVE